MYLLHRCNQGRWVNPFEVSTREIERDLMMSRPTIIKARATLQSHGLIDFREGKTKGKSPAYSIAYAIKKSGDCVKEINTIGSDCVNVANRIGVDCVNDCVKEIKTIAEKKESFPPHPLYKEKKEKNKEKKNLASLDTHDARARERVLILGEGDLKAIEQLRVSFSSRMARETLMRQNGISSVEEYRSICDEILGEWLITKGEDFEITEDVRKHFINLVRVKSEKRKGKGGGRAPTMAERDAERERKRAEREAHDATAITFEEYMRRVNNA
jgi:predicted transcriptional regulator